MENIDNLSAPLSLHIAIPGATSTPAGMQTLTPPPNTPSSSLCTPAPPSATSNKQVPIRAGATSNPKSEAKAKIDFSDLDFLIADLVGNESDAARRRPSAASREPGPQFTSLSPRPATSPRRPGLHADHALGREASARGGGGEGAARLHHPGGAPVSAGGAVGREHHPQTPGGQLLSAGTAAIGGGDDAPGRPPPPEREAEGKEGEREGKKEEAGAEEEAEAGRLRGPAFDLDGGPAPGPRTASSDEGGLPAIDATFRLPRPSQAQQAAPPRPDVRCPNCDLPVAGLSFTALNRVWHPDCFVCRHCGRQLGSLTFFEMSGHPYCLEDYHQLFSPRCGHCGDVITDQCINALGKSWHVDHFFCCECGRLFQNGVFHEHDGKAYCEEDCLNLCTPKCGACGNFVLEESVQALDKSWHPGCFVCKECKQPFPAGSFYDVDGSPYCELHFHAVKGSLCGTCQKPILGKCVTAIGKKFHPEHFVCQYCARQLSKLAFKQHNGKPYCMSCYVKLFG